MSVEDMLDATQEVTDEIRDQAAEAIRIANTSPGEIDWRPIVSAIAALTEAVLLVGEAAATAAAIKIEEFDVAHGD